MFTCTLPAVADDNATGVYFGIRYAEIDNATYAVRIGTNARIYKGGDYKAAVYQLGYAFSEHFALEARYLDKHDYVSRTRSVDATTAIERSLNRTSAANLAIANEDTTSVFARVSFRPNRRIRPYLLGGFTKLTVEPAAFGETFIQMRPGIMVSPVVTPAGAGTVIPPYSESVLAYGYGIDLVIGNQFRIGLEYNRAKTASRIVDFSIKNVSAGISYWF